MRKLSLNLLIVIAVSFVVIFSSCRTRCLRGSGKSATENRKLSEFTKLKVSNSFKVNLKQDSSLTLSITGDDNLLKYVSTSVEGDI